MAEETVPTEQSSLDRSAIANELADPAVRQKLHASIMAEVGTQGDAAKLAYVESVMNRALARGHSLDQIISDTHYYPKATTSQLGKTFSANQQAKLNGIIDTALGGSNVSNFATGNESGDEHSGGAKVSYSAGGERFVIENPDVGWAKRAGASPTAPSAAALPETSRTRTTAGLSPAPLGRRPTTTAAVTTTEEPTTAATTAKQEPATTEEETPSETTETDEEKPVLTAEQQMATDPNVLAQQADEARRQALLAQGPTQPILLRSPTAVSQVGRPGGGAENPEIGSFAPTPPPEGHLPPPPGAIHVGSAPPPPGAIRVSAPRASMPPAAPLTPLPFALAQSLTSAAPTSSMPPPQGAVRISGPADTSGNPNVVTPEEIAQHEADAANDPKVKAAKKAETYRQALLEATEKGFLSAHSSRLSPEDQRVTSRVNPETGTIRTTGSHFVPGDPVNERLLQGVPPEDRAKLPALSTAISRGDPFSFLHYSAPEEAGPSAGVRPTAESRAYEQAVSTAGQRAAGGEGQLQRVTMIPQRLVVANPKVGKARTVTLEGFANDAAMNNTEHLLNGAQQAEVPVPYQNSGFDYQRDLAGYLMNQAHGYRGDGQGPIVDAQDTPNHLWQAEQQKPPGQQYVPHLLSRDRAEFINAAMNIVPSAKPVPTTQFGQRAQDLSHVNQSFIGQHPEENKLRSTLDRKLPQVGMRNKKGEVTRHVPWSQGTLEPTYRAYRLENIRDVMPPLLSQSIRQTTGPQGIMKAPIALHTAAEFQKGRPGGGAENPEIGSPETSVPTSKPEPGLLEQPSAGPAYSQESAARFNPRVVGSSFPQNQPSNAPPPQFPPEAQPPAPAAHIDPARVRVKRVKLDKLHWMPTADLDEAWRSSPHNKGMYIPPGGTENTIGNRYPQAQDYIAGQGEMHAPEVSIWDDGTAHFGDGRHRFAAMRDAGHTHVPVALDKESVTNATKSALIPPEGQPEPPRPEEAGREFVSPNVKEGLNFAGARRGLKTKAHAAAVDFHNKVETALAQHLGTGPAEVRDAIGDWSDGAENSTTTSWRNQPIELRRQAAALKGLNSAQKAVISFEHDPEGEHSLYTLRFPSEDPNKVRDALTDAGIQFRTLEPPEKGVGTRVHVVDMDGSAHGGIAKLLEGGHLQPNDIEQKYGNAEFLGDPEGNSREVAARAYRRVLQEARDQASQGGEGQRPGAAVPWFDQLQGEAEQNYQNLSQSKDIRGPLEAEDLRQAAIDRANMSPEERQKLDEIRGAAQKWVEANPDVHPLSAEHFIGGHEQFPEDVRTKEDIGKFFNRRNKALDYSKARDRDTAVDALTHDIMHAIAGGSEAPGWYNRTVDGSIRKVAEIAPDILSNPDDAMAYKLATAITSQGQDVFPNFESGYLAYRHWKQTGEFPTDPAIFGGGAKNTAMSENFEKINRLWKEHGTEGLRKILETPMTMRELRDKYGVDPAGESLDHVMEGAAMLGPKIGSFFNNLNKRFHTITFDLWASRNMNRLAGDMFKFSDEALRKDTAERDSHLSRMNQLLESGALDELGKARVAKMKTELGKLLAVGDGKMTREKALRLAPTIAEWADTTHRAYAKGTGGRSYPPELKTPSNSLAKNIDLNLTDLSDAPRNASERQQWRQIFNGLRENLEEHGVRLNNADLQAVLWYSEQKLFQLAGSRNRGSYDYLDSAHRLVRKIRSGQLPGMPEALPAAA